MSRAAKVSLHFTLRAISDLEDILEFSTTEFGKRAANKYIDALDAAFARIQTHPELLVAETEFHPDFRFYRANKHLIVCDVAQKRIIVLAIISTSMDIPQRLAELSPILKTEIKALNVRLKRSSQSK